MDLMLGIYVVFDFFLFASYIPEPRPRDTHGMDIDWRKDDMSNDTSTYLGPLSSLPQ